jgi:periplasmic divalent cation tolerance protein
MDDNCANVTASPNVGEREKIPTANEDVVLIYTTFPSQGEAEIAGRHMVEAKLAACVNILPGMVSIYPWQGKIETASEVVVLIKTAKARAGDVLDAVKRLHPYDVPARLVLPVAGGGADFLSWITAETSVAGKLP